MIPLSRRQLLKGIVGTTAGLAAGCSGRQLPPRGEILSPTYSVGHRVRDGLLFPPAADRPLDTDVVIVGGGISGLAAAWTLRRAHFDRFVVLELEPVPGGTARGGKSPLTAYPWGAHYVPVPMPENRTLISILRDMQVIERLDSSGAPVVAEQFLCRDPSERVFAGGRWHEGLYPFEGASEDDLVQLRRFRAEMARWARFRDSRGRRAFAIPIATGSEDAVVTALDRLSMADWMTAQKWNSPRLHWLVDYSCRDDYGSTIEQTSAWAGIFYFASRLRNSEAEPQAVITWPEGNARIVRHLAERAGGRLRCGVAVHRIAAQGKKGSDRPIEIHALDVQTGKGIAFRAHRAIFAAPQMLARFVLSDFPENRRGQTEQFDYSPWLVANLHLRQRPQEMSFPLAWDNVLYGSQSLGYVAATHQSGMDFGPTVLTWYRALCDPSWAPSGNARDAKETTAAARRRLLELTWPEAAEIVLQDLEQAHGDIRPLVERLDLMKWGHAMVRPRPGFVWSQARKEAARPFRQVHFAGTDLSGIALCEEAVYHGVRAAEEVLNALHHPVDSLL